MRGGLEMANKILNQIGHKMYKSSGHLKIRFENIYKNMENTTSIWWLLKPEIKKRWNGKRIYIGTRGWYFVLDFREINNIYDFVKALAK